MRQRRRDAAPRHVPDGPAGAAADRTGEHRAGRLGHRPGGAALPVLRARDRVDDRQGGRAMCIGDSIADQQVPGTRLRSVVASSSASRWSASPTWCPCWASSSGRSLVSRGSAPRRWRSRRRIAGRRKRARHSPPSPPPPPVPAAAAVRRASSGRAAGSIRRCRPSRGRRRRRRLPSIRLVGLVSPTGAPRSGPPQLLSSRAPASSNAPPRSSWMSCW